MSEKAAILWPLKYSDLRDSPKNSAMSWQRRMQWVCSSLSELGFKILQHKDFLCDIPEAVPYNGEKECDVLIYNHTDISEIEDIGIKAQKTWFFKPTVPDVDSTSLDEMGYGSYSSITYSKPDYKAVLDSEVENFYDTKVKNWVDNASSKWGAIFKKTEFDYEDYHLILGQCGGDAVLVRQDFSAYFQKMLLIIKELNRVSKKKIVVKLHPYTNGIKGNEADMISYLLKEIEKINKDIIVIHDFTSVHSLLPKCHSVIVGNSGSGMEAMMHKKPIISFCFPEYHWVTYDLRKMCDIHRAIKTENWYNEQDNKKFLYWYAEKYCFYDKQTAKKRILDLLSVNTLGLIS